MTPAAGDPRLRLAGGLLALWLVGRQVQRDAVGARERVVFGRINDLPDALWAPGWLVMQAGTIGAVPVAAGVAAATGRRALAGRLLAAGVGTWLLAKVVKRGYARPRPLQLLTTARGRGAAATGDGYVSGHAGVAVALVATAWPELPARARRGAVVAAALVGTTRMYVGAHLPLDVVGGAALGLAVEGAVSSVRSPRRCRSGRRPTPGRRRAGGGG